MPVLAIGALVAVLGIYMAISGDVRLLHSYHYATTPAALKPVLARETGGGLAIAGIGCALMGVNVDPGWCTIAGLVLLFASIACAFACATCALVRKRG